MFIKGITTSFVHIKLLSFTENLFIITQTLLRFFCALYEIVRKTHVHHICVHKQVKNWAKSILGVLGLDKCLYFLDCFNLSNKQSQRPYFV